MVIDQRFFVYLIGGILSAAVDVAIFQILLFYEVNLFYATTIGFTVSLCINYLFHAKFTFSSKVHSSSFAKYLIVVAFNYMITLGMVIFFSWLISSALVGKIVSLPIIAIIGYFSGKYWIYK
jgi:putative flippase GtrA